MSGATVLVTAAGSAPAIAVIRGLRTQEEMAVRIVAVDVAEHSAGLFLGDVSYILPPIDDPEFEAAVRAVCSREDVDVVMPVHFSELQAFAAIASDLERDLGLRVVVNSPEALRIASDKNASYAAVTRTGVAVPPTYTGKDVQEAPLPLIVKPRAGTGSVGVTVVRDRNDLGPARDGLGEDALVQSYIEGPEYTVDLVMSPAGRTIAAAPRRRVEVRGGQTYKGVTVDHPRAAETARICAEAIGLTGPGNVQLIEDVNTGDLYFIEVNPKFAAALGLTIAAGLNVPLLYLKLALGFDVGDPIQAWRPGVWMLRSWQELFLEERDFTRVRSWRDGSDA